MTDEKTDTTAEVAEQTEPQPKPRSLDVILNLDYSELTSEEIDRVVEWKAEQKAKSEEFEKQDKEAEEAMEKVLAEYQATADAAAAELKSMQDSALNRLARASRGELV